MRQIVARKCSCREEDVIGSVTEVPREVMFHHKESDISDEIKDVEKKIDLLDGDRKAYYENSQWTMQRNKNVIQKLRTKNKNLRLILAKNKAGDEKVIDDAFRMQDPARHCAMRGMSGAEAIAKLDQQVCETKKQLNNLKNQRKMRAQKLALLITEYDQMVNDAQVSILIASGDSCEAQQLRILENRLDKMRLKLNEAYKIRYTYVQILEGQKDTRRTWPNQLDALELGIIEQNGELKGLRIMYKDAQCARDSARSELSKLEQAVYEKKKAREIQLKSYKLKAEEKREHAENVEKRMIQRVNLPSEDTDRTSNLCGEEHEKKIMTYEDAMSKIKEATGVSNIQEVVKRFLSQASTKEHLEQLQLTNQRFVGRLRDEEVKLKAKFEEKKYSGEAKMSSGQRILEGLQDKFKASQKKCGEMMQQKLRVDAIVIKVKSGTEHLADKLHHIKGPKNSRIQVQLTSTSEEYIIDLLAQCEQKLVKLLDELGPRDINDIIKEMENAEFRLTLEGKVPINNTRVKILCLNEKMDALDDDDDDSGGEDDRLSRTAIKLNSQQIIDSKLKKEKGNLKRKSKK